jgi:hypothetical protein
LRNRLFSSSLNYGNRKFSKFRELVNEVSRSCEKKRRAGKTNDETAKKNLLARKRQTQTT